MTGALLNVTWALLVVLAIAVGPGNLVGWLTCRYWPGSKPRDYPFHGCLFLGPWVYLRHHGPYSRRDHGDPR